LNALSFTLLTDTAPCAGGSRRAETRSARAADHGRRRGFCFRPLSPRPNDQGSKESLRDYFVPPVHILKTWASRPLPR
jgi:hypothetical protein